MVKTLIISILCIAFMQVSATPSTSVKDGGEPKLKRKQKTMLTEARILLKLEDYYNAKTRWDQLLELFPDYHEFQYGVGVCLINTRGDEKKSFSYLEKGLSAENMNSYYWYGRSMHLQHHFDKAVESYMAYKNKPTELIQAQEADRQIAKSRMAARLIDQPRKVEVLNLGTSINTNYQESVPLITSDESVIYFTSRRANGTSSDKDPTGQYYQDIYYSEKTSDGWTAPQNMGSVINSNTHDATVGLSSNGNVMITYRTNPNVVGGDLYITENSEGIWSDPKKLGKNINTEYQEPSASISSDEQTMYFSSTRPGGYGGMDIYKVIKLPNGSWSLPQNLGPEINTVYDEDAPFISVDSKTIYFSSKGHPGIGGFDVFKSKILKDGSFSTPENLGFPINSVEHDIYFTINADERVAYYSSDMDGGYGDQDIYRIIFKDKPEDLVVVSGYVYDLEGIPLKAKLTVLEMHPERVNGVYRSTSGSGKFITLLYPGESFQVIVESEGYLPIIQYVDLSGTTTKGEAEKLAGELLFELKRK
ncbi:MAG: PD40 domain-containing protein [Flavobacteriales bacterium]|nr:PD40 domain-containing protein [Flavobacteriales bacterium]